jgi:hypothetical protein
LPQIPAKKRAERFEIFTEEDNKDEEGQKQEENLEAKNKENGHQRFSPGKENIAPIESAAILNDSQANKNSPFEETFESFELEENDFESDENSPTEYLTAKSSLILLSTKPKPQEKNPMVNFVINTKFAFQFI